MDKIFTQNTMENDTMIKKNYQWFPIGIRTGILNISDATNNKRFIFKNCQEKVRLYKL